LAKALSEENLNQWLSLIPLTPKSKNVALILAGNIPLVGFHDFLSVLISDNVLIKTSSNEHLLPFFGKYIIAIEPKFADKITLSKEIRKFDAIIATGVTIQPVILNIILDKTIYY
jgi:hypothetical protein